MRVLPKEQRDRIYTCKIDQRDPPVEFMKRVRLLERHPVGALFVCRMMGEAVDIRCLDTTLNISQRMGKWYTEIQRNCRAGRNWMGKTYYDVVISYHISQRLGPSGVADFLAGTRCDDAEHLKPVAKRVRALREYYDDDTEVVMDVVRSSDNLDRLLDDVSDGDEERADVDDADDMSDDEEERADDGLLSTTTRTRTTLGQLNEVVDRVYFWEAWPDVLTQVKMLSEYAGKHSGAFPPRGNVYEEGGKRRWHWWRWTNRRVLGYRSWVEAERDPKHRSVAAFRHMEKCEHWKARIKDVRTKFYDRLGDEKGLWERRTNGWPTDRGDRSYTWFNNCLKYRGVDSKKRDRAMDEAFGGSWRDAWSEWRKKLSANKRKVRKRGKSCKAKGCLSGAVTGGKPGYCINHGGGRRCKEKGCGTGARGKTGFCISHGGGRRCKHKGCGTGAETGGYCINHGGGMRCKSVGCQNSAHHDGFCATHQEMRASVASAPSVEGSNIRVHKRDRDSL